MRSYMYWAVRLTQSVARWMFEIDISAHVAVITSRSWVQFPVRPIPHVMIERASHFKSVDYLRGLWFSPTLHYKSPNIIYRAMS
jgi:hypothetical protein